MKERISALMDGEHDAAEFAGTLAELRNPGEALDTWQTYHLISDALRDTRLASPGFAQRVSARILEEPAVLAPAAARQGAARQRLMPLYAAASFAAIALVGWMAFAPQPGLEQAQVAKAPAKPAPVAAVAKEPVTLPLTDAANDYLLAHQAYSPRNSFQGVAPYVRTVTDRTVERRR
jgi:sigma-E factor negative regulatory protein RseA